MTDQQIACFLAIAEHLNFTEAARDLDLSQSTMSKQIALLEKELEVQLFFRNNRHVKLTPTGAYLQQELSILTMQKELVVQQAKYMDSGSSEILSVGVQDVLWNDPVLFLMLQDFREYCRNLQYSLEVHVYQSLMRRLHQRQTDIVISRLYEDEKPPVAGVSAFKLKDNVICLLVHKDNPLARRESVTLAELKDEKFIVLTQKASRFSGPWLVTACQKAGFQPQIAYYANCNAARIMYVELGCGVTLMSEEDTFHQASNVRKVAIREGNLNYAGTYAMWMKDAQSPVVQKFAAFLKEKLPERAEQGQGNG